MASSLRPECSREDAPMRPARADYVLISVRASAESRPESAAGASAQAVRKAERLCGPSLPLGGRQRTTIGQKEMHRSHTTHRRDRREHFGASRDGQWTSSETYSRAAGSAQTVCARRKRGRTPQLEAILRLSGNTTGPRRSPRVASARAGALKPRHPAGGPGLAADPLARQALDLLVTYRSPRHRAESTFVRCRGCRLGSWPTRFVRRLRRLRRLNRRASGIRKAASFGGSSNVSGSRPRPSSVAGAVVRCLLTKSL
jgi:hypothetical protein